ncbi:MAG: thioredoxin domain-containing protein [Phycisphaeraceae bacterium]|nr:MAG: thioredoxin domain-containing protein [Phycisphaeraceae bacterium]
MTQHPPNRLAASTSPYLLQHARNPVEWYPWGEEAFEAARRRGVPIFLSIGYSTCYWCHVMERESFEDPAIAALLNEHFVCVKVDREERPDVDDVYMQATLAVRGQGGWPMTLFLEPASLKPFWCATYIPPAPRHQMPGLPRVVEGISNAWTHQRESVLAQADAIAEAVGHELTQGPPPTALGSAHAADAVAALLRLFDRTHGGFGSAPKFPQPVYLDLLLGARRHAAPETVSAIDAALRHTLDRMACGGIHDHLAGGFHRYSVDAHWTVPHFEKMLYDNALLAATYARASAELGEPAYARVASGVCEYLLREMRLPGGAFASAQDAEVHHREGLNYLWTTDQLVSTLGPDDARFAADLFGVSRGPNFQDPHHPDDPPASVLRLDDRPDRLAQRLGFPADTFLDRFDRVRRTLYDARLTRDQPARDDKVLTAWNGLAIDALAQAGALLRRPDLVAAAAAAARFVLTALRTPSGGLLRVWRDGRAHTDAFLEDYVFLALGLLALDDAEPSGPWLGHTRDLMAKARDLFRDADGSWFDAGAQARDLFVRPRSAHDGALPAASTVTLHVLLDLAARGAGTGVADDALRLLRSISGRIHASPTGSANAVRALLRVFADPGLRERAIHLGVVDPGAVAARATTGPGDFTPVEILADVDRVALAPGEPARVQLKVRVAPGYHVIAADPGPNQQGLIPFRVTSQGGRGLGVYADYPPGTPYPPGVTSSEQVLVYAGEFDLEAVLEPDGEWDGRPLLAVVFQACTDSECLAPSVLELDIAIDRP